MSICTLRQALLRERYVGQPFDRLRTGLSRLTDGQAGLFKRQTGKSTLKGTNVPHELGQALLRERLEGMPPAFVELAKELYIVQTH